MTVADLAAALALWQTTPGVGITEGDDLASLTAFLARNPEISQVACDRGDLIGTCCGGHDGRRGMLYHVAVRTDWRRRGVARTLVDRCLQVMASQGVTKCNLLVYARNVEARAAWAALGFTERGDLVLAQHPTSGRITTG
jgi:ribosomal protein S18 acetylase RimI-like enzyme